MTWGLSAVLGLLRLYKKLITPLLPPMCRFHPTCSEYSYEAFQRHGLARGSILTLKRLSRCHPFHPGGFDPVR
ncbi:MAG TPA: membrane protein insertion efficiency factor YidD [Patescibacteria group bacterium]|jgi:putative membrane protein insertion efficiency factor|nr:membrane protein insertion efficiency factor YidD [Patescibacteria group bacterium]